MTRGGAFQLSDSPVLRLGLGLAISTGCVCLLGFECVSLVVLLVCVGLLECVDCVGLLVLGVCVGLLLLVEWPSLVGVEGVWPSLGTEEWKYLDGGLCACVCLVGVEVCVSLVGVEVCVCLCVYGVFEHSLWSLARPSGVGAAFRF